jgi:hypothetical protein
MSILKIFLAGLIICGFNISSAQISFQKTIGGTASELGYCVQQIGNNRYIISGSTSSFGAGNTDVYLIRSDGFSNILKTFGGTNDDVGYSVQQTNDSGYIVAGSTNSFGAGEYDVYLIKTNANGDSLWTRTFGGTGSEEGYSVRQTTDGGYIIAGYTNSFGAGGPDVYLIKTNANGNLLWSKTYGGTEIDEGYSVQQTADGGYIIAGYTYSFGAGSDAFYLIKTDVNGDSIWTRTFAGIYYQYGNCVQQTADGGYIIAGDTYSFGAGNDDVYLIKTDANGNLIWSKTYGGTENDVGSSVQQTTDGGYIISGTTNSFGASNGDAYLIRTNASGDTLWTKTFGGTGEEAGLSVQQTPDGGYVAIGHTNSFGAGTDDIYLIRTDTSGISGCNERNPATIVTSPATQVTGTATIITSAATIQTSPATIVGNGNGNVTPQCSPCSCH